MERLTQKRNNSYVFINGEFHNIGKHINKLGQIEDIEEELGIDLIMLFRALRKNGIWIKSSVNTVFHLEPSYIKVEIDCDKPLIASIVLKELYFEDLDGVMDTTGEEWFMEDYGETWALTREELENA